MIYLIGGPPRSGKTTLAKLLSQELKIPYVITDDIQKVVRAYIPKQEHDELFPFRRIELECGYDNDLIYAKYSVDKIVQAYICQAKSYWPGFRDLAEYCLR